MLYTSTNHSSQAVNLSRAATGGFADDGGLYMPAFFPALPTAFFRNFTEMSLREMAYVISSAYFGDSVSAATLKEIADRALDFEVPVKQIGERIYAAELFHGPTLTCKDFGARFMAHMFKALMPTSSKLNILVSTSGNTGSAVANAFNGMKNVNVFVLYPKNKLTRQQENELVTLADNIHAIEVQGTIDDCKDLQQKLLASTDIFSASDITIAANSINICRIIPQIFYIFYSVARMIKLYCSDKPSTAPTPNIALAMPCGNLGNLVASIISQRMGLPLSNIIASFNCNDALHRYLVTSHYSPRAAEPSLAYALDSGANPFNMPRINHLCNGNIDSLRPLVHSHACDDSEICHTINHVLDHYGYMIDPHTAVAWTAMEHHLEENPHAIGLVLATAHPAKSLDAMTTITGRPTELPLQLTRFMGRQRRITKLPPTLTAFKRYLTTHSR